MSVSPASVAVSLGPDSVVVTLQGVTAPAEREYARDRDGKRLLERFYEEVFDASRPVFETAVADVLSRPVERSKLSVDAESGSAVIIVALGPAKSEAGEQVGQDSDTERRNEGCSRS